MYIQELSLQNFRCFGESQTVTFRKGLNVLVGENDSGKSAIIDAIRIVLGTTDQSWYHVDISDFYGEDQNKVIKIVIKFAGLTEAEQAAFLECLSFEAVGGITTPCLYINWNCRYLLNFVPPRVMAATTTGVNGDGPSLPPEAKELLRVTYLRPLRDAYSNMQAGRHSRLSQIMQGIPELNSGTSEYTPGMDLSQLSITGIADLSNKLLANHPKLKSANKNISDTMTSKMLLKGDSIRTSLEVAGAASREEKKLAGILEKLDLSAHGISDAGKVGLGTSNILSMACELLLNQDTTSSFLLIEEPEAHVHAQRQLRLIQSLQSEAGDEARNHQIIITTHSPLIASVVKLDNIIIVKDAKSYSLGHSQTKLEDEDYEYLERYLDATKANLFFAKAVMIVEGPSEELFLPTVARLLGSDLTECGISIVNVRGIGMRRFARIFQRADESRVLEIKVACITDRDVMPDCAPELCIRKDYADRTKWPEIEDRKWRVESDFFTQKEKDDYYKGIQEKADGQQVKTFVSDHWTFEYDLAYSGLAEELIEAIVMVGYVSGNREKKKREIISKYNSQASEEAKASYLYSFFTNNGISKAEVAQKLAKIIEHKYANDVETLRSKLPRYIIDAISYLA